MDLQVLNQLSYGVFVLTTETNGCIINTAIQLTEKPYQLCIVVNKSNLTHDLLIKEKRFNISILNEGAKFDLISHFGFQSGINVDKFKNFRDYDFSNNGIPFITEGSNGYISVNVSRQVDLSTHTLFIGEITEMKVLNQIPSITYRDYHEKIKPQKKNGKYRCLVCGYEYEGENLPDDFICPWCGQGKSAFEKIENRS